MGKYDAGADTLRAFAERMRGVIEVADVLQELGSLENSISERKSELAGVNAELDSARAALAAAKAEKETIEGTHATALEAHEANCRKLSEAARYDAEAIVQAAKRDADELRAVGQADVRRAHEDMEQARTAHAEDMKKLAQINEAIDADIVNAKSNLAALKEEHVSLTAKVERVREFARGLVAG